MADNIQLLRAEERRKITEVLSNNGMIVFPTDTIWGVGCDATDPVAVERIYKLKRRPKDKPLIVLVDGIKMLKRYVSYVHPKIQTLLEHHQRPLTVIYPEGCGLAPNLLAQDGSIGIRIVMDDFCREMIAAYGKPLVATSANISGEPFPGNFGEVSSEVIENVDYVVKNRQSEKELNKPSVIIRLDSENNIVFLRE